MLHTLLYSEISVYVMIHVHVAIHMCFHVSLFTAELSNVKDGVGVV